MAGETQENDSQPCARRFRLRLRLRHVVIALVFAVGGLLIGSVYRGTSTSLDAENTHQAYVLTFGAVTNYVQQSGQWPKNWDELLSFDQRTGGSLSAAYMGIDEVKARVKVDFQLGLRDVAAMTPETFTAIKQRPPNYPDEEGDIAVLLKLARTTLGLRPTRPDR